MKPFIKTIFLLLALSLLASWALVSAQTNENVPQVELKLKSEEVKVSMNEKFDPFSLVVSGSYDALHLPIVNTSKTGEVQLTFIAEKDFETIKVTKNIFVMDGEGPVITGEDILELKYDSQYDILEAYTVSDNIDTDIELVVEGEIDRLTPGEYPVVIKAVDSSKNTTLKEVLVKVLEDPEALALEQRNEEYSTLVVEAQRVNDLYLSDTTVETIESILNQVNSAKGYESDYQAQLETLSQELASKLVRAQEFYAPEPVVQEPTVSTPAPVAPTPAPAPVQETSTTQDGLSVSMTRYGMDCYGCQVVDGVAHTSHGIALTANSVRQPNGVWQDGITYNGRFIVAGNRNHVKCTLVSIYDHPYEGMGIVQGQPIHAIMADNGAFGYNHIDLFVGTETNLNRVWVANASAQPYAVITGFATFTGSGCSF